MASAIIRIPIPGSNGIADESDVSSYLMATFAGSLPSEVVVNMMTYDLDQNADSSWSLVGDANNKDHADIEFTLRKLLSPSAAPPPAPPQKTKTIYGKMLPGTRGMTEAFMERMIMQFYAQGEFGTFQDLDPADIQASKMANGYLRLVLQSANQDEEREFRVVDGILRTLRAEYDAEWNKFLTMSGFNPVEAQPGIVGPAQVIQQGIGANIPPENKTLLEKLVQDNVIDDLPVEAIYRLLPLLRADQIDASKLLKRLIPVKRGMRKYERQPKVRRPTRKQK